MDYDNLVNTLVYLYFSPNKFLAFTLKMAVVFSETSDTVNLLSTMNVSIQLSVDIEMCVSGCVCLHW